MLKNALFVSIFQIRKWKKKHSNPLCRAPLIKSLPNAVNLTVQQRTQNMNAIKMETDDLTLKE